MMASTNKEVDKKKIKRKSSMNLDKEAKEAMKRMDDKMEELRQKCFAEINRLESIQERENIDKGHRLHDLEMLTSALMMDTGKYNEENTKNMNKVSGHITNLLNNVKKLKTDIFEIKENSPEAALKNLQK